MRHAAIRRYFRHGMLPQLMVFEAVARLGSFTRAGEELSLAQPTVSVQIRKLTDTVGLPLFESPGRKVVLTEGGRELLETVQVLFRFFIAAEERLDALRVLRGVRDARRESCVDPLLDGAAAPVK